MEAAMRLGVDLGGTKIAAVVLDRSGVERWRDRTASPSHDYDAVIETIAGAVAAGESAVGARCSIGVGIPGAIDPATGLVKNANTTALIGRPFDRDLAARLGRPVRVANDANCLLASEAVDGAAAGAAIAFGAILGTGVGGAVAVGGAVLTGAQAIAGEWGHNPLPWPRADERPGPPCYCGRAGCIEMFLSGPAFAAEFGRTVGDAAAGRAVTAAAIGALAAGGEPAALAAIARYAERLARALATVINLLDPEIIVLGGGVSRLPGLLQGVAGHWGGYVFSPAVVTRLKLATHGDDSGVRGAARLWPAAPNAAPARFA